MSRGYAFNRVTFGLPVESYRVEAFITKDERLPVVTEFVLRLLRICGPLSVPALRDYFGFTQAESLAVVDSLSRQGLVVLRGESLQLSSYAIERFEETAEDYPRFSKVEARRDSVTFDLLSFSPLPSRSVSLLNELCVRLNVPEETLGKSIEQAKLAYFRRFAEIARLSDDLRYDALSVYSVEDIQSKRRGYLPIPTDFLLDEEGQVQRRVDPVFDERAAPELVFAFHERVSRELPAAAPADMEAFESFVEAFEVHALWQYVTAKRFDLFRYAQDVESGTVPLPKGARAVFGNLYLEHNLELLTTRLRARRSDERLHRVCTSALWLAPDDALWGRSDSLLQATRSLSGLLKDERSHDELALFLPADAGAEKALVPLARGVEPAQVHAYRPRGAGAPTRFGSLELFLYPTCFMAALFHFPVPNSPGLLAPVGFVSSVPRHVDTAYKLATSVGHGGGYGGRVSAHRHTPAPELLASCGFLNYSPVLKGKAVSEDPEADGE